MMKAFEPSHHCYINDEPYNSSSSITSRSDDDKDDDESSSSSSSASFNDNENNKKRRCHEYEKYHRRQHEQQIAITTAAQKQPIELLEQRMIVSRPHGIPTRLNNLRPKNNNNNNNNSSGAKPPTRSSSSSYLVASDKDDNANANDDEGRQQPLPPGYFPSERDIVLAVPYDGRGSSINNVTSIQFEVLLHQSLLPYLASSPQRRGRIIDDILSAIADSNGKFVVRIEDDGRRRQTQWAEASRNEARTFAAREMKQAAREVLTATLRAKRRAEELLQQHRDRCCSNNAAATVTTTTSTTTTSSNRPQKRVRIFYSEDRQPALQAKFKRPRKYLREHHDHHRPQPQKLSPPPVVASSTPPTVRRSDGTEGTATMSPLELLSSVASSRMIAC